jgi:hypothetical protein
MIRKITLLAAISLLLCTGHLYAQLKPLNYNIQGLPLSIDSGASFRLAPSQPTTRIVDSKSLDDRMFSPENKDVKKSNIPKQTVLRANFSTIDLGSDMYLLDDVTDPTSTVLEIRVDSTDWQYVLQLVGLEDLSEKIYSVFNDDFDFIFFVLNIEYNADIVNQLGFYGINIGVSDNVDGDGNGIYDTSHMWSSAGKLKSVMFLPYHSAILTGPTLHELCHNWAAYICPTYAPDNLRYDGHWGVSNAGGQLGGFRYVRTVEENCDGVQGKTLYQASFSSDEKNLDGSFKYPGFGVNANGGNGLPYSDIELYLMGMKSAQELRDADFHLDIYSGNDYHYDGDLSFGNGYFYSTTKTSYTIDDIIAMHGERMPDFTASQKQFKILTVAITPDTATTSYSSDMGQYVRWLAGGMDDDTYSGLLYNFRQATNDVGSLVVDDIKSSIKWNRQDLLSDIVLSAGTLTPAFNPYIFDYIVTVPADVETMDITGVADHPNATVTGHATELPLILNDYTYHEIQVSNEKGESQIYHINIIRGDAPPVRFKWKTDSATTKIENFIGIVPGESLIIDWGDGTQPEVISGTNTVGLRFFSIDHACYGRYISHTYNTADTFQVTIYEQNGLTCPLSTLLLNYGQEENGQFVVGVDNGVRLTQIDISKALQLRDLYVLRGEVAELDVSRNRELRWLSFNQNKLTELDLNNNEKLVLLECGGNQLTHLDVSHNIMLQRLVCNYNQLTTLNISTLPVLTDYQIEKNLFMALDVSHLPKLRLLNCSYNTLTTLDVSKNIFLESLGAAGNQLTNLDLRVNTALMGLGVQDNQLTELNVSNQLYLWNLSCANNKLTELDVSNRTGLFYLGCENNQLKKLDISGDTALLSIDCYNNALSLSNLYAISQQKTVGDRKYLGQQILSDSVVALYTTIAIDTVFYGINTVLNVYDGILGRDYIFNNGEITFLSTGNYTVTISNPAILSNKYDPASVRQTFLVNNSVGVWGVDNHEIKILSNPVKDELKIILPFSKKMEDLMIYDSSGRTVWSQSVPPIPSISINVSNLPKGIYIVRIGDWRGKFVKE